MLSFFKRFLASSKEEENRAFRQKYDQFRELLERNNEVLETISLLADIRDRDQWISLGKIRSLMTRTAVNVYRLIQNLNFISDNQYKSLDKIFASLEAKITAKLEVHPPAEQGPLGVALSRADASQAERLGAKAANLGEIAGLPDLRVPDGLALTTDAYHRFLEHNDLLRQINKELLVLTPEEPEMLTELSERLTEMIMQAQMPEELHQLIQDTYQGFQKPGQAPVPVVLRSSAVGEDAPGSSFAGLYQSVINPPPDQLDQAYKAVVASKFSPRALTYFMQKGIYHDLCPMGVLMMELVQARAGGVMFTRDSQGEGDAMLISGVWGLGKLAVEGSVTPDTFRLSRGEVPRVLEITPGDKPCQLELLPGGGTARAPVEEDLRRAPCLTEDQLVRLARLGRRLEQHFESPQDVEWSIDAGGRINIVQCRPLVVEPAVLSWTDLYPWQEMARAAEPLVKDLQVGSAGAAAGPAVVLDQPGENGALPSGAVVLVSNTAPDLVNILPRAAAVVAARGNLSGHLALIAREFNVPLVIGLPPGQTELLTGQDQVTVDAFTGAIYPGRVEALLECAKRINQQAQDTPPSPLHRLLDEVLQYVTPLNLVNPRDPSFRLQSIRTIHDIIRFAHESAINAMFGLNDSRLMGRGKVVRLRSEVPLDIYLIDLGGGIAEGASPKRVDPEDITSIPMRALYEGMTTPGVRWAGHVPIDFRGFMSVFANTMFDGAKYERKLGDHSYAILSRHYVNFSSRLGYHFSIVDAYLGRDPNDNYLSFRFKGGAARLEMRTRRARFLGEVLRRFDFWVDQKSDLINARIKRLPREQMEEKLRMLGRLMGCSRQLDVTMHNEEMVERYIELFLQGDYTMGYGEDNAGEAPR